MSLFTPVLPTPAQSISNRVKMEGNALHAKVLKTYVDNYNAVWNTPNVSPIDVVAAMGTEAVKVFTLSAALRDLLVASGATGFPLAMPETYNFQANPDGSVTLTLKS